MHIKMSSEYCELPALQIVSNAQCSLFAMVAIHYSFLLLILVFQSWVTLVYDVGSY